MMKKMATALILTTASGAFAVHGINSGFMSSSSTNYKKANIERQLEEERRTLEKWDRVRDRLVDKYGEDAIPVIKNAKDYNDCLREVNKQYDKDRNRCDRRSGNERSDCEDRAERVQDKNSSRCERIGHSDNLKDAVSDKKDSKDKKDKNDCQGDSCKAE
jgi:hypothetical protein